MRRQYFERWIRMSRSELDDATSGAAVFSSIQLKFACCWLCLAALAPMFAYYFQNFRIVAWPIEISGFPAGRDFVNLWSGGRSGAMVGHSDR